MARPPLPAWRPRATPARRPEQPSGTPRESHDRAEARPPRCGSAPASQSDRNASPRRTVRVAGRLLRRGGAALRGPGLSPRAAGERSAERPGLLARLSGQGLQQLVAPCAAVEVVRAEVGREVPVRPRQTEAVELVADPGRPADPGVLIGGAERTELADVQWHA